MGVWLSWGSRQDDALQIRGHLHSDVSRRGEIGHQTQGSASTSAVVHSTGALTGLQRAGFPSGMLAQ